MNALLFASMFGYEECVDILLKAKANVNIQTTGTGTSSLMYAAAVGRYSLCVMLIENGADVRMTNKNGKSALDWAKEKEGTSRSEIIERLQAEAKK